MDASDDIDYGLYATLDEVLLIALDHVEQARHAGGNRMLAFHLVAASRAMRCAMEIFGNRFALTMPKEEK